LSLGKESIAVTSQLSAVFCTKIMLHNLNDVSVLSNISVLLILLTAVLCIWS